jgi:iron complex outermembrane receptor protein
MVCSDGAFIGRGQEQGVAFFDIDRVEVLRGPQGTLYGRSSTGGAINVITRKPVLDRFEGYARVEAGNYDTRRAEAAINIPLTPILAVRIAGNMNDRDGYLRPVDTTVTGATVRSSRSTTRASPPTSIRRPRFSPSTTTR